MTASNLENVIAAGHYLIINKNETYLIHQISNKAVLRLGRDIIDLRAAIGQSFSSTYKLEPVPDKKRHYSLIVCDNNQVCNQWETNGCGTDNKLITDDSSSQLLSTDEIIALKESGETGQNIVERLLENSKTFQLKTEYAQDKYLKKKAKKYCDYLTIFKPTIRLITDVLYKQQTIPKTISIRFDTLAQILCRVNLDPSGKYLLYENGSQGLLQATLLNQLHNDGCLVHVFSSTNEQNALKAVKAMNFSETKIKQMLTVNLDEILNPKNKEDFLEDKDEEDASSFLDGKKRKSDEAYTQVKKKHRPITSIDGLNFINSNKFDGLIVVCREEPIEFVKTLLPYLSMSRPFVVYSAYREILVTMYAEFKMRRDLSFLRLTDSFMRYHQVLPNRTHPDVTMDDGELKLGLGLEKVFLKYGFRNSQVYYVGPKAERGTQEIEPANVFKDQQLKFHEIEEYNRKNIIEGNGELDIVARDHDETVIKHLQAIANLTKKFTSVDDFKTVLIKTKCELSTALRRQILDDNADEMKKLGIHPKGLLEKTDLLSKTKI